MEKETKIEDVVKALASELLGLVGVSSSVETTSETIDDEPAVRVVINAEREAGLLIGAQGATLQAIQSFLAIAVKQKTGEWVRVLVDVGDWRQKQEDNLKELAAQAAERARATGEAQHLYNLTPHQRRIVHMALVQEKDIVSGSEGEGLSRYLVVKTK